MHDPGRCVLCDEIKGRHALSSQLNIPDAKRRILFETEEFLVLRDIWPLVVGHYLLVTRDHLCSLRQLDPSKRESFAEAKRRTIQIVGQRFSPVVLFEHGTGTASSSSGACIEHAHIHVLPICDAPVLEWMEDFGRVQECTGAAAPVCSFSDTDDYLFFEQSDGRAFIVLRPSPPVPHQFIRREIGAYLGKWDWNWKTVFALRDLPGGTRAWNME